MAKYYDEQCLLCEGCHFFGDGVFPNGKPYKACRRYGYILHPEKGVSLENCTGFRTEEQWRTEEKLKEKLKKEK